MVNIYCCTNFTASNNYIHKVIAVTCIVRINAAVISSSSSSNPISPEWFACSKWAIPENIHTIPRTASIFSSPITFRTPKMCYPPCPWNAIIILLNPLLFGFSIFLSNSKDSKIYIAQFGLFYVKIFEMTLLRTAMHKRYINSVIIITSVLQSRWPAQRKSYMYMNPEIREWKFKNN